MKKQLAFFTPLIVCIIMVVTVLRCGNQATSDTPITKPTPTPIILRPSQQKILKEHPELIPLKEIAAKIGRGEIKNILIMTGAGISVSAGIPDFRSKNGFYNSFNAASYGYTKAEDIFDIHVFVQPKKSDAFYEIISKSAKLIGGTTPTPTHKGIKQLIDKNRVLRYYTQNIDGLDQKAGVPDSKAVYAHGTFATASCMNTSNRHHYTHKDIEKNYKEGTTPYCQKLVNGTPCGKIIKPDVVFFHENLPTRFSTCRQSDCPKCDLLIIIGTSCEVSPFNETPLLVPKNTPRIVFNKDPLREVPGTAALRKSFHFTNDKSTRDYFIQGLCDDTFVNFLALIPWTKQ